MNTIGGTVVGWSRVEVDLKNDLFDFRSAKDTNSHRATAVFIESTSKTQCLSDRPQPGSSHCPMVYMLTSIFIFNITTDEKRDVAIFREYNKYIQFPFKN